MSSLIGAIIVFLGNALALKIAAGAMGASANKNTYTRALSIAFWLLIASFLIGFVPIVSGLLYAMVWVGVIMTVYELSFLRSVGVAIAQFAVKIALLLILKLVGLSTAWVEVPMM
ncbi:MAG: hypothetical protein ACOCV2_00225 [Persicimonas sp.]